MQLTASILVTLFAVANAVTIETPLEAQIRRDVLLMERAGENANRPVASGLCCVANTSLKEDVCTTTTGAAGKCVPEGQFGNCNGALNCVASSLLTCNNNVLENGRPTCRTAKRELSEAEIEAQEDIEDQEDEEDEADAAAAL